MLWQPRWIAGHLLVLAIVVSFVRLGFWQLDRHAQHVERNERVAARLAEAPMDLGALLDEPADLLAYRRVQVAGRWDTEHEVLLRSQTYRGQPGWHVLTPLVFEAQAGEGDGRPSAVIVDRGWVPQGFGEVPVDEAAPPRGRVEVRGVLLPEADPPEGPLSRLAARNPPEGELDRTFIVDVERLERQMPYALVMAYLVPTEQTPPQPGDLPVAPEPPGTEAASHLAYAVQWFVFASIGVVGYTLLLRQRLREDREEREQPGAGQRREARE